MKDFLQVQTTRSSLKPVSFIDILGEDTTIFKNHVFACTGSYNFRTVYWDPKTKTATQQKIIDLLNSFAKSYVYETYSTTNKNSTDSYNAPAFFSLVENADKNTILGKLKIFIQDFADHTLSGDRKRLADLLATLNTVFNQEVQQNILSALNNNYTDDAENMRRLVSTKTDNQEIKVPTITK